MDIQDDIDEYNAKFKNVKIPIALRQALYTSPKFCRIYEVYESKYFLNGGAKMNIYVTAYSCVHALLRASIKLNDPFIFLTTSCMATIVSQARLKKKIKELEKQKKLFEDFVTK